MQHGRLVAVDEMSPIDLVVVGCVAVSRDGGRTGKGAGFADLELGLLRQQGLIQAHTPIVTTVHALQIVPSAELPMLPHDWLAERDPQLENAIELLNASAESKAVDDVEP